MPTLTKNTCIVMNTCLHIYYITFFTTYTHTQWGGTAVYNASANGHSEVVKLLVQAGADLELQHKVCTFLHP